MKSTTIRSEVSGARASSHLSDPRKCASEFVGTYFLVVAGPGSIVLLSLASVPRTEALVLGALAFGGIVALMILLFGRISGSMINPAITLAAASANLLRGKLVILYILFQIVGGVAAGLTLRFMFGALGTSTYLGSTRLAIGITPTLGIAIEAAGTFALATSVLLSASRVRKIRHQALTVGGVLSLLILLMGPFTGAGFNPARSLGPALASGYFSNFYVYLIGPLVGALLAGLLFRRISLASA